MDQDLSARGALHPTLVVRALVDSVVEAHGFAPTSPYIEHCALGIWGPTASWAYRRLGRLAEVHPEGARVDLVDLARSLGLGEGLGKNSLMMRALTAWWPSAWPGGRVTCLPCAGGWPPCRNARWRG